MICSDPAAVVAEVELMEKYDRCGRHPAVFRHVIHGRFPPGGSRGSLDSTFQGFVTHPFTQCLQMGGIQLAHAMKKDLHCDILDILSAALRHSFGVMPDQRRNAREKALAFA